MRRLNRALISKTIDESSDIPPEDRIRHFQNLLYDKEETLESHTVVNPPSNLDETTQSDEILNGPITVKEIHDQISKLKNKKAPGTDTLLNEMLKHGRYYLIPSLGRIFNDIIETGTFPTEWNIGVIKPIYKKKGDKKCPANHKGNSFLCAYLSGRHCDLDCELNISPCFVNVLTKGRMLNMIIFYGFARNSPFHG